MLISRPGTQRGLLTQSYLPGSTNWCFTKFKNLTGPAGHLTGSVGQLTECEVRSTAGCRSFEEPGVGSKIGTTVYKKLEDIICLLNQILL